MIIMEPFFLNVSTCLCMHVTFELIFSLLENQIACVQKALTTGYARFNSLLNSR